MFAWIAALALGAAPAVSAPSKARHLEGTLEGLIRDDDYPAEALDRNEQGDVEMMLLIDGTGSVANCTIKKSSGSAALDRRTCEILQQRAKFKPALDRRGRPITESFTGKVSWRIGEYWLPSQSWAHRMVLDIGPDQRPISCRFEFEGAMKPVGAVPACSVEQEGVAHLTLNAPASGGRVTRLIMERRFEIGMGAPWPIPEGYSILRRFVFGLRIDAAGKLQSCTPITQQGEDAPMDPCSAVDLSFEPRPGPDGKPAPFDATFTVTHFAHAEGAAEK